MMADGIGWVKRAAGVWSGQIGSVERVTPLSIVDRGPSLEALSGMGEADNPFDGDSVRAWTTSGKTIVSLPLHEEERIYGFGLQFHLMNHRGRTKYLRVNSDPKEDTGESHAPVPFFVSSRGYGVLVNTARIATVHCGSTVRGDSQNAPYIRDRNTDADWLATPVSDLTEIVVSGDGVEILLFAGDTMMNVVRRYNLYCGGGTLPPRWGLGFWHRVPSGYTAEQVMEEAEQFRLRDFPCDVIGLEPGWHSSSYPVTYEWSKIRFPDPRRFMAEMSLRGFQINLWENPYVAPSADIYPKLAPLSGSYTVWGGVAPDYTVQEAREIYMEQHRDEHVDAGAAGYKLDECDGSELTGSSWMFPAHAEFPSGLDGEQMRQVYGLLFQQMTDELYRQRGRRTYGLVRASNAGSAPMPYVLYSDLYDHRQFVRALCNSGFSGLLWTPEVRETRSAEEFVRRMQVVCFSPLAMLNAWSSGVKPWTYPEVEPIIRKYLKLRMRLIPYLYTLFANYYFEGVPPIRSMQLAFGLSGERTVAAGDDDIAYKAMMAREMDDQFMVGDDMLVAPLFAGESGREVILPEGDWYDFETGELYEGGRVALITAGLDRIPVFMRCGAIVPLMPELPHVPAAGEAVPLTVRHYGNSEGRFELYDDDGQSFAYEAGGHRWRTLAANRLKDGSWQGSVRDSNVKMGAGMETEGFAYSEISWEFMHK
ncbi:TIM-barrel domain-containing protein [Paenibacillus mendelii]|uniref:TIM-barrel domain-containing protein n=1 Tax=Paenibacillus mendelii TaxID=206163 RepID=A0ABV6J3R6_9BACL|nr:TIM-barrel domain-containing protein [Paenibacillus mendelii]MCQ6561979.1 DUF5110 domain-containing protein [Paenibacillus mendelii]